MVLEVAIQSLLRHDSSEWGSMPAAHDILQWVRQHGEVMAVSRLGVRMMEASLKERLPIRNIDVSTTCSQHFLDALRKEASVVVGKPCPL